VHEAELHFGLRAQREDKEEKTGGRNGGVAHGFILREREDRRQKAESRMAEL
jgi:hypothetical protein